jgi:hypothetical protein
MRVRFLATLPLVVSAAALSGLPGQACAGDAAAPSRLILAQNALQPIPQPSARRAGELEDWSGGEKKAPAKAAPNKKTSAAVSKPREKAPQKEAKDPEDGGLPLPNSRKVDDGAPVGFDAKGNVGTSLKF